MGNTSKTTGRASYFWKTARVFFIIPIKIINYIVIALIIGIRPFLGPAECRYFPSCGKYAIEQLEERPLLPALVAILKRLLSCNFFFKKSL